MRGFVLLRLTGGYLEDDGEPKAVDTVHVLDPITGQITLSENKLPYGAYGIASIVIDNALYLFGGTKIGGAASAAWMKYTLYVSILSSWTKV